MDIIPKRTPLTSLYRKPLNLLEKIFPISKLNPNYIQIIAIILSVAYMFSTQFFPRFVLISIILFSDWLDGAAARSRKEVSKTGWMKDVLIDRISEGFIFAIHLDTNLGKTFFGLYIVNTILSIYSVKTKSHLILPLRFIWMIYLGIQIWV